MIQIGRYQIVRELAVGGMARVFLAKAAGPRGFQKTLVLKIILPHLTRDPNFVEMFLKEARVAAQFTHPNLVQIFELGEFQGTYFIAMEYIDGPNLRVLAKRAYNLGVELSPALCAKVIWYACEGLGYAHDFADPDTGVPLGLVHRDISPENIIVSRTGTVKVVDFGIAKGGDAQSQHTKAGVVKGKIAYMSPEVIRALPIDRRVDVFALGVVLYEMLTGCRPYRDATTDVKTMQSILFEPFVPLAERQPTLPAGIVRIVERALEKDRDQRYSDCREMQADLEAFLAECGESATPHQLARLVAEVAEPPPLPTPTGTAMPSPAEPMRASDIIGSGQFSIVVDDADPASGASADTSGAASDAAGSSGTSRTGTTGSTGAAQAAESATAGSATKTVAAPAARKPRMMWAVAAVAGALLVALAGAAAAYRSAAREERAPSRSTAAVPVPAAIAAAPAAPAPVAVAPVPESPSVPRQEPADEIAVEPADVEKAVAGAAPAMRREVELAAVTVTSNVPGRLRINGRFAGAPPVRLARLRPGKMVVELLDASGAVVKEQAWRLAPGDNGTKALDMGEGTLEFRIRPYATVIVDGKPVGETPLTIKASEGAHRIVLVNKELGKEIALTQMVKPNERTIVRYILDE